jgi:hypothetical protein
MFMMRTGLPTAEEMTLLVGLLTDANKMEMLNSI